MRRIFALGLFADGDQRVRYGSQTQFRQSAGEGKRGTEFRGGASMASGWDERARRCCVLRIRASRVLDLKTNKAAIQNCARLPSRARAPVPEFALRPGFLIFAWFLCRSFGQARTK